MGSGSKLHWILVVGLSWSGLGGLEQGARGEDGPVEKSPPAANVLPCSAFSAEAMMGCVEQRRYVEDLLFIAAERPPESKHWLAVQNLCYDRLRALGYEMEWYKYDSGVNVVGRLPGTTKAAEQVIVSSHYDSLAGCPAADDNASGLAGLLEIARVLAKGKYERTLVVVCWDENEKGNLGASAFAADCAAQKKVIAANYVLEAIGYKSDLPNTQKLPFGLSWVFPDQTKVVQNNQSRADYLSLVYDASLSQGPADVLTAMAARVSLKTLGMGLTEEQKTNLLLQGFRKSDHGPFWAKGYPGVLVSDSAEFRTPGYHCLAGKDTPDVLDPAFATQVIQTVLAASATSLAMAPK